jgi:hypothetical protein
MHVRIPNVVLNHWGQALLNMLTFSMFLLLSREHNFLGAQDYRDYIGIL